jgi:DNA-binding NtrC family response regulator
MSTPAVSDPCALVVDDDQAVAKVLAAALRQQGIAATLASSAEEALRLLDARPFDVVLSDVRMPGASGLELLAIIHRRWRDLPVVLLTAHGTCRSPSRR